MPWQDDSAGRGPDDKPSDPLMAGWSIEATLPKPEELEALAALLPPGTQVFLSTLPHVTLERQIDAARRIRASGLEPVPHIAARYFADSAALEDFIARAADAAAIRSVLVIGGDLDNPRGPYTSALNLVQSGLLQAHGINEVGFAGYPDGHPAIPDAILDEQLDLKLQAATAGGLRCRIITQFCFQPEPILSWVSRFSARHPGVPVRIGLAGPASVTALVRYALRCGVAMPKGGLRRKLTMASRIARNHAPSEILSALDTGHRAGALAGADGVHFFSFGGLEKTARWALEASES